MCALPSDVNGRPFGCLPVPPKSVVPPGNPVETSMHQRLARVQAEAKCLRFISGPKQKEDVLEKYQNQHGMVNQLLQLSKVSLEILTCNHPRSIF